MKHPGATHCDDCGLTWIDDGLNPLSCPYCALSQERKRLDWALTVGAEYKAGCLWWVSDKYLSCSAETANPRATIDELIAAEAAGGGK